MLRVFVLLLGSLMMAAELSAELPSRRPLDLPSGGKGPQEDAEEYPETIQFFGGEYEGDAFMFVIDTSGSMFADGKLESAQEELSQALMSLSGQAEFGIVAFSTNLNQFSIVMEKATMPNKVAGVAWVNTLVPNGGTCIDIGTIHGLDILRTSLILPASRRLRPTRPPALLPRCSSAMSSPAVWAFSIITATGCATTRSRSSSSGSRRTGMTRGPSASSPSARSSLAPQRWAGSSARFCSCASPSSTSSSMVVGRRRHQRPGPRPARFFKTLFTLSNPVVDFLWVHEPACYQPPDPFVDFRWVG